MDVTNLNSDASIEKSDHYSASSEDSDSTKKDNKNMQQRHHVRKHKASESTECRQRSSSEDSILDNPHPQLQHSADKTLYLPAVHPNFPVQLFSGNVSGTEEHAIEAAYDPKDEKIMQLEKMVDQLQKQTEEKERESSMKDERIKELEKNIKELQRKQKGGIISQIRRRSQSNTNRTNLSPLNKRFSYEF